MKNDFLEAMNFRHACKVFDENKKINDDDFKSILEAGRLSPSSFGFEPWRFLIVQNQNLRNKLKNHTWGGGGTLPTCSHFVIILARTKSTMIHNSDYLHHMMHDIHHLPQEAIIKRKAIIKKFQEEDFDLLSSEKSMFEWSSRQTYIALANMMSLASIMKIDSCPIEGFIQDKIENLLTTDFDINKNEFKASVMVAFGYRINEQKDKTRQKIEDISKWY